VTQHPFVVQHTYYQGQESRRGRGTGIQALLSKPPGTATHFLFLDKPSPMYGGKEETGLLAILDRCSGIEFRLISFVLL
jgi:hypothetical protein